MRPMWGITPGMTDLIDELAGKGLELDGMVREVAETDRQAGYHVREAEYHLGQAADTLSDTDRRP